MLTNIYSSKRAEEGFTLIELLIVVIIIGILAAIALPVFIDQQKVAVDASVQSDLRNGVTNVVNAQAQGPGTVATLPQSRPNTKFYLDDVEVDDADPAKAGVQFTAPSLGGTYVLAANNAGGKKYVDDAFTFTAVSGQFSTAPVAGDGADPDDDGTIVPPPGSGLVAPNFTTSTLADGSQNVQYSQTLTATGTPAPAFSLAATSPDQLPAGLTLTGSTISGTPTVSGTFNLRFAATNSKGTDTQDLTLTIAPAAPAGPFADYNFDDGTLQGWSSDVAGLNPTTFDGASALQIVSNASDGGFQPVRVTLPKAITEGKTYHLTARVYKASSNGTLIMQMPGVSGERYVTASGQWTNITIEGVATSRPTVLQAFVSLSANTTSSFYIDSIKIVED